MNNGIIETDLFSKPTDKHQHLLYSSCHPYHTKKAIPYSLALRLRRICSTDEAFNNRCNELTEYLVKRGYKHDFIRRQIKRATDIPRITALRPSKKRSNCDRVPFVLTYNPALPNINKIIQKNFNLLLSSTRCKNVFKDHPIIAFRRTANLRDILVKAKLPSINNTAPLPPGSYRCGKNCITCPYIINGLTTYTFTATGETRTITSHFTCDTKNVVYMIQCNRCKLQYIGETKRKLKERFNDHRRTVDNPASKSKPTNVSEHFMLTPNHSASDMQLIPLEKFYSNRDSIRKAREAHLIIRAGTLEPNGLNLRDET